MYSMNKNTNFLMLVLKPIQSGMNLKGKFYVSAKQEN